MVFYIIFVYFVLFCFIFHHYYIHTTYISFFCSFAIIYSCSHQFMLFFLGSYVWIREDDRAVLVCLENCPSSRVLKIL